MAGCGASDVGSGWGMSQANSIFRFRSISSPDIVPE